MKITAIAILFVCFIAAAFNQWFVIICFQINQATITKEYCVNKNNPAAHCNGHCYLNKQMNKEENPDNPFTNSSKEKFEIQLFCIDPPRMINVDFLSAIKTSSTPQNFTAQEFVSLPFHPPCKA